MTLHLAGHVALPEHKAKGGFDHAAVHAASGHVYVAHTANDAVDVFDPVEPRVSLFGARPARRRRRAGERRKPAHLLLEPRREHDRRVRAGTRSVGSHHRRRHAAQWPRLRPDAGRSCWRRMSATRRCPARYTLSMIDLAQARCAARSRCRGRTRWTVFDPEAGTLLRQHRPARRDRRGRSTPARPDRPQPCRAPRRRRTASTSTARPSGCSAPAMPACSSPWTPDRARCWTRSPLSGVPDVVFFNRQRQHLYVAVGDPGVIDCLRHRADAKARQRSRPRRAPIPRRFRRQATALYAFLPRTHRAAICSKHDSAAMDRRPAGSVAQPTSRG